MVNVLPWVIVKSELRIGSHIFKRSILQGKPIIRRSREASTYIDCQCCGL